MKKILSLVVAVALCGTFAACGGNETSTTDSGDVYTATGNAVANRDYFEWSPTDDTMIVGYTEEGLKQTELVIPEDCTSVQGLEENTTVKYITFESDDTEILSDTFRDCTSLESVELPANLTIIDEAVFYGCTSLKQITIPDSVTELKSTAFCRCDSLTSVTLSSNITSVSRKAFYACTALQSISIPDTVTAIEDSAFEGCTALTEVTFGAGIETIGESAFQTCTSLKTVKLQEGVTELDSWAFAYCDELEEIYLPESIESIATSSIVQTHDVTVYVVEGSYMDRQLENLMGSDCYNKQYQ